MKKSLVGTLLLLSLVLASCSITSNGTNSNNSSNNNNQSVSSGTIGTSSKSTEIVETGDAKDAEEEKTEITSTFSIVDSNNASVTSTSDIYTITTAGEYTLTGNLSDGYIIVDAADDAEVILNLNGVSISSTANSPIYIKNASKVKIKAKEGTYNEISDLRSSYIEGDGIGSAAIYSECDLNIQGKGSLVVNGNVNNGIHTKDDLEIKNLTLKVTALDNALKGNDEVEIQSGDIFLISTGGDGIKTSNSDISSKQNQKGNINILGATNLDIYAACDGIDSSYNVNIESDESGNEPNINIFTDSYSKYTGTLASISSTKKYFRVTSAIYNSYKNNVFAAYLYNNDGTYTWKEITYKSAQVVSSGNSNMFGGSQSTTYYIYEFDMASGYQNIQFYMFSSGTTIDNFSTTNYLSVSGGGTINENKDLYNVTKLSTSSSSKKITGDWQNYTVSSEYSKKGIKSDNEINISAGEINIKSDDDSIHATYGATLENGSTGLGNVTISGGTVNVMSGDDGIHADSNLNISGGLINVINAYEGLEGNVINISGGLTYVYGSDDGVNATSGVSQTLVNITGGLLDVTVGSGDTDGIDSNGNYKQTGGVVITKNPTSDSSGNMAALDIDGTFTMTGGTFIAFGPVSTTPSGINYKLYGTSGGGNFGMRPGSQTTSSYSFTKGTYSITLNNETITTEVSQTCYSFFIASEYLVSGTSYTLYNGSNVSQSWTQ